LLKLPKLGVLTFGCEQILMSAFLYHRTTLNHHNAIGINYR
jgi:hypothetical protein